MAKHISQDDVDKIAALARLDLTKEERAKAVDELGSILDYIDRLSQVNTRSVEPYAESAIPLRELRHDIEREFSECDALVAGKNFKDDLLETKAIFNHDKEES